MTAQLRAVLFDAAGTLIELCEPVGETYSRVAEEFGVSIPATRLEEAFLRVFRAAPAMAFPGEAAERIRELEQDWWRERVRECFRAADQGQRFADFAAFFEALYVIYSEPESWRARPDAAATLTGLRERGLRTGVVSNFDQRLPAILAGLGLASQLETVVLPADAGAAKPDGRPFALALERLGVAAAHALYVGDDADQDIAGALAAGLHALDVGTLASLLELPKRIEAWTAPQGMEG